VSKHTRDSIDFAEAKKRMYRVTVLVCCVMYIATVWPLMYMGIKEVSMHIVGFFALMIVFPIGTFFLGMWLVWKKKFFPLDDIKVPQDSSQDEMV